MGESIQKRLGRVRPPRVQITYDVEVGDAIVKKELPFVMGIMADLAGDRTVREDLGLPPLPDYKLRAFAAVDRDNFDDIMKTVVPALRLSGLDRFIAEDASAAWREGGVEPEKAAFLKEIGEKKYTIQRSKGLGENDPEMMWLTTMNPESRRLIKVLPTDVEETARVFDLLLGDNLAGRKEHIAEHGAEYLDDLDVS